MDNKKITVRKKYFANSPSSIPILIIRITSMAIALCKKWSASASASWIYARTTMRVLVILFSVDVMIRQRIHRRQCRHGNCVPFPFLPMKILYRLVNRWTQTPAKSSQISKILHHRSKTSCSRGPLMITNLITAWIVDDQTAEEE